MNNKLIMIALLLLPLSGLADTNAAQDSTQRNKAFLDNFKHTAANGICHAEGIQICRDFSKNTSCTLQVVAELDACFDEILGKDIYTSTKQRLRKSHKHLLFCMLTPYLRNNNEPKSQSKDVACSKMWNSFKDWKFNTFYPLLD